MINRFCLPYRTDVFLNVRRFVCIVVYLYIESVKHLNPSPLSFFLDSCCYAIKGLTFLFVTLTIFQVNISTALNFFSRMCFWGGGIVVIQLSCQFSTSCYCALALKYACIDILASLPEQYIHYFENGRAFVEQFYLGTFLPVFCSWTLCSSCTLLTWGSWLGMRLPFPFSPHYSFLERSWQTQRLTLVTC